MCHNVLRKIIFKIKYKWSAQHIKIQKVDFIEATHYLIPVCRMQKKAMYPKVMIINENDPLNFFKNNKGHDVKVNYTCDTDQNWIVYNFYKFYT